MANRKILEKQEKQLQTNRSKLKKDLMEDSDNEDDFLKIARKDVFNTVEEATAEVNNILRKFLFF